MAERQFVIFELEGDYYGIDIMQTKEIVRIDNITPIPNAPAFVEGVVDLRGKVIPIIDIKKRLGVKPKPKKEIKEEEEDELFLTDDSNKKDVIIVNLKDDVMFGLMVDRVIRVHSFKDNEIQPPPPTFKGIGKEYLKALGKKENDIYILIDVDRVLTVKEKEEVQEVVGSL